MILEAAKSVREDYLHQNAFHEVDTYTSLNKQYRMLKIILSFYYLGKQALEKGADVDKVFGMPVREKISRLKYVPEAEAEMRINAVEEELKEQINNLVSKEAEGYA